jgi:hypothetical protein
MNYRHIYLFQIGRTQLKINGKTGYIFRLKQAVIGPITRALKGKLLELEAGVIPKTFRM